ncbi:MAG: hypothetical protein QM640_03970 [Niabella sp.]
METLLYVEEELYFACMNRSQLITIIAAIVLVVSCFMKWMHIPETTITITGIDTTGTRYGKPAYNHFILAAIIVCFAFIPKIWAKRFNLLFGALNLAWAIRNFSIIPGCDGGICPEKLAGLYLLMLASIILMITVLFPKEPALD